MATEDGLALLKKVRDHVGKEELLASLQKLKVTVDQIEGLFLKTNEELQLRP